MKTTVRNNSAVENWLVNSTKEMKQRGWEQLDIVLITGDAYVDHPSFGVAVIGRVLENAGFKVGIVAQPNWQDDKRDFKKLGQPRLFFGVTSGAMDSMVNHYTANRRLRSNDAYSPAGKAGFRPDYATTVYSQILKQLFPDTPVVLGGIEASLRRFTHYDYWSNELKTSILVDSKADLLVYGMGEKAILEIAYQLNIGNKITELTSIPQTAFIIDSNIFEEKKTDKTQVTQAFVLNSHEKCIQNKKLFADNFVVIERESNKKNPQKLIQQVGNKTLIVNPPYSTCTTEELDAIYNLPFTRLPHPRYANKEAIPAYEMIKFSVNIHRGCFGGCSFCTISAHQGKFISWRSTESVVEEVKLLTQMPDFKGYISDLGGPSANMYAMCGIDNQLCLTCAKPSCIFPTICKNLNCSHLPLLQLYRKVREIDGVKAAFIGSGIRYDLLFDNNGKFLPSAKEYFNDLFRYHISGRLKVAPEHTVNEVLTIMRKPSFQFFKYLKNLFDKWNEEYNKQQQLIPYFISSHPGCSDENMAELAIETKNLNFKLEQVQDFTPTPMTLATVMYYTGINPITGDRVQVPRTKEQKLSQQKFFFWYKSEFRREISEQLKKNGRNDLITKLFSKKQF